MGVDNLTEYASGPENYGKIPRRLAEAEDRSPNLPGWSTGRKCAVCGHFDRHYLHPGTEWFPEETYCGSCPGGICPVPGKED